MSAVKINALVCDREDCTSILMAVDRESAVELRARARRENGWGLAETNFSSIAPMDLCRFHA